MIQETTIPNREYLELNYAGISATRGRNEQFVMEKIDDDMFLCTQGRVGIKVGPHKPKSWRALMSEWDDTVREKLQKGFIITKTKKTEEKTFTKTHSASEDYKETGDESVDYIINSLLAYTNGVLASSYTVKIADISSEQLSRGREILNTLTERIQTISVAEFNTLLLSLFSVIPRRMDNVNKMVARRQSELNDLLAHEQELFEIMKFQVGYTDSLLKYNEKPTVPEAFDLTWRRVTDEEADMIKSKMGDYASRYNDAWAICNNRTQKRFDAFCKENNLTTENGITSLFHGSRSENFFSIITNGLTINPQNVVITGKAFGNGTYFSSYARKSSGYTSTCGSYWANGNATHGYMGIYDVATGIRGTEYHPNGISSDLTWNVLQRKKKGALCTLSDAGEVFRNNEVVVYRDEQSTIKYLVEIN